MKIFRTLFAGILLATLFLSPGILRAESLDAKSDSDTAMAAAHAAAKGDPLLEALLVELDRSKAQLKMDQVQSPYYIEYHVSDIDDYSAEAAFGALRESQRVHLRFVRVATPTSSPAGKRLMFGFNTFV